MYCLDTFIIRYLFDKIDSPEILTQKDVERYEKLNLNNKKINWADPSIDISKSYTYRDKDIRDLILVKIELLNWEDLCITYFAYAEILTWFKHGLNVKIKAKSYERLERIKFDVQKFIDQLQILEFNTQLLKYMLKLNHI